MKYTRFLDLHLIANDGWYDFAEDVSPMASYVQGKFEMEGAVDVVSMLEPDYPDRPMKIGRKSFYSVDLPAGRGLVHVPVKCEDMIAYGGEYGSDEKVPMVFTKVMEWLCDPAYFAKLRLNVHGCSTTGFIMGREKPSTGRRKYDTVTAAHFAFFLVNCGLRFQATEAEPLETFLGPNATKGPLAKPQAKGPLVRPQQPSQPVLNTGWGTAKKSNEEMKADRERREKNLKLAQDMAKRTRGNGVATICLCVCSGAGDEDASDHSISSMKFVAECLASKGIHGIDITAAKGTTRIKHTDESGLKRGQWIVSSTLKKVSMANDNKCRIRT